MKDEILFLNIAKKQVEKQQIEKETVAAVCKTEQTSYLFSKELLEEVNLLSVNSVNEAREKLEKNKLIKLFVINKHPQQNIDFLKESLFTNHKTEKVLLVDPVEKNDALVFLDSRCIHSFLLKPIVPLELDRLSERIFSHSILQKQLQEVLTEVSHLDDSKKQFMFLVNHELKTPLTAILSFLAILEESALDAEQKNYVSYIRKNSERLNKLIFDILELTSAKATQLKLNKQKQETKKVFSSLISSLNDKIQLKNLDFIIDDNNLAVSTDNQILQNVLRRLADNAITHSPENSKILLSAKPSHNNSIEITVENSAENLTDKNLEEITKPFVLKENMLNHSKGLGLGLSISQALLKCLDSKLILSSEKENFSAKFTLPSS